MSIYRHSCGGTTVSAQYREDHHERITPRLSEVRSWGRAGGRRFRARIQLAPRFRAGQGIQTQVDETDHIHLLLLCRGLRAHRQHQHI